MENLETTADGATRDPEHLHEEVLRVYETIGYPRDIVGSWAISENDVNDFVSFATAAKPKKILEIGTYVGVSTMLLALACPDAQIFTVDPDLPLSVEMSSARSLLGGVDGRATTHVIARQAAARLNVAQRIEFVRGGFAVGDTFSSVMQTEGSKVEIVGPRLCAEKGPFDLIFVDGLHSAEAVAADLELAAKALAPNGIMVLHDCVGYWGASVRSGVFRFLRKHPRFQFSHPAYADIYKSVGVLKPRESIRGAGYPLRKPFSNDEPSPGLCATLAQMNSILVGDRDVVEISFGPPMLENALSDGRTSYSRVTLMEPSRRNATGGVERQAADIAEQMALHKNPAAFSADLLDFAGTELVERVLAETAARKSPLVLAITPPGETGVAGPWSRPIAALIDLAEAAGCAVYQLPSLDIEFERYALLPQKRDLGLTSLYTFLVVIGPPGGYTDANGRCLVRLTADAASDEEQLQLQRVHLAAGYRRYYEDRNALLLSNSEAGRRVRDMESSTQVLKVELERSTGEVLRLASRFADHADSLRQLEQQRLAQEQRLAEHEQTIEAVRREVAVANVERQRAVEIIEITMDALQTIDFIDVKLRAQERVVTEAGVSGLGLGLASDYGENSETAEATFAQLVAFRDRFARLSDATRDVIADQNRELAALRTANAAAEEALRQVHASTSWRITAPVRLVRRAMSVALGIPNLLHRRAVAKLRGRELVALQSELDRQLAAAGAAAPVFDASRYEMMYQDVPAPKALRHYLVHGEKEGRRPTHKFDPQFYCAQYPDVVATGASPLLHFLKFGLNEGRSPCAELHPLAERAKAAGVSPLEYLARAW